jgi:energy-coupling factor transporter ATP-binding protein EcfA2
MYLKTLEIHGFKSFADKTVFEFAEGVTGIVGPNGCGKSNVVDAIRWVLGETSAKALRGGEMADVIFNGTEKRKPLGMAEVTLTMADCEESLKVDYNEVAITRRVFRDGRSEYRINGTLCRLKDIHDMLMDTGIGRTAYSIMAQGQIDQILSSKPEERRAVFEEAAGITKFKREKKEALRKLEYTEANLLRVSDVLAEQERRMNSLRRQVAKARRYQALAADTRVLDTHLGHKKFVELTAERDELSPPSAASRCATPNSKCSFPKRRRPSPKPAPPPAPSKANSPNSAIAQRTPQRPQLRPRPHGIQRGAEIRTRIPHPPEPRGHLRHPRKTRPAGVRFHRRQRIARPTQPPHRREGNPTRRSRRPHQRHPRGTRTHRNRPARNPRRGQPLPDNHRHHAGEDRERPRPARRHPRARPPARR